MNNVFKEVFEKMDSKKKTSLIMLFLSGILLIFVGNRFNTNNKKTTSLLSKNQVIEETKDVYSDVGYEEKLEKKLKQIYEKVDGAGEVSVMLTLSYGREIVVAQDLDEDKTTMKENNSSGIIREQSDIKSQGKKIILTSKDGENKPLILKEIEPKVSGVVIVCEGGDDILVADALVRATQTVLGVEPHKVQVLKGNFKK